jgi:hypothetical protein
MASAFVNTTLIGAELPASILAGGGLTAAGGAVIVKGTAADGFGDRVLIRCAGRDQRQAVVAHVGTHVAVDVERFLPRRGRAIPGPNTKAANKNAQPRAGRAIDAAPGSVPRYRGRDSPARPR